MNFQLTYLTAGLIIFCIIVEATRQLCFKAGSHNRAVTDSLKQPIIWFGIVLWVVETIIWLRVLMLVPLSIAFPLVSLVYVLMLILGAWFFKEKITVKHAIGAVFITMGVACVGATGI